MSIIPGFGKIKIYAGSGCPALAKRIADHIGVPLSPVDRPAGAMETGLVT